MKSLKVFLLSVILIFAFGIVFAQEASTEAVNLDENIQPEDLGISEPKVLPDSPFYFLKNLARGIQQFLTFNPVKKAELRMKFANEKLMEMKKLVEEKKNPEIIKKATEDYQKEVEKIKNQADKTREKARENPQVESFLNKFIHQQTLHQKLLDRLETQVPPQAFEKIKEARERHLERFKDVMLKLEDRKEKIAEKLDEILEKQKGSEFKEFKNLEVLKKLEEKVPEEAKEAIQKAQENALKRLETKIEALPTEKQEELKNYIEKISGDKETHLEILEDLKALPVAPQAIQLKENLEEIKTKVIEGVEEKMEKIGCPAWAPPALGFCKEGRVIIERDPKTGCPLAPKCVIPGELEIPEETKVKPVPQLPVLPGQPEKPVEIVCPTLWDPVCGKDGKTYSNKCFAKLAEVEIDYIGECRARECQSDADCPQPRCGPAETKCIGVKSKCVEGKCQIEAISPTIPVPSTETKPRE